MALLFVTAVRPVLAVLVFGAMACVSRGASDGRKPSPRITMYPTGPFPRSVAVGDLDGDGHRDVVVANAGDATVRLFLGAASGELRSTERSIAAGNEPSDVDVLDIDRDGDMDLLVANHETSFVTALINDGTGSLTAAPYSPMETYARPHVHGLATGDFDGDTWPDVAVEGADTREIRVLRGGPEGFGESTGIPIGTMPYYRIGKADLTADGRVEILVPGHGNNTVLVVDRGREVLTDLTTTLSRQPWMVAGDDVNGDRRIDMVVIVTDGVSVLLASPEGFVEAPGSPFSVPRATEVATGDLDGDGIADIVVGPWEGSDVTVIRGGTFVPSMVRTFERPIGLAVADLDGDRRGELIVASATENRLAVVSAALGAPQEEK